MLTQRQIYQIHSYNKKIMDILILLCRYRYVAIHDFLKAAEGCLNLIFENNLWGTVHISNTFELYGQRGGLTQKTTPPSLLRACVGITKL